MNNYIFYFIMGFGVLISAFSQMLLKKSARKHYARWWRSYVNLYVISAYGIFVLSTLCTVIAMRRVPLSTQPFWNSLGIILVALLGMIFFHEFPSRQKAIGLGIVLLGMLIFSI